ncbi:MAG: molybdopterin dinucleotide-binding protein [Candidatus Bathyarchaeota archaeon]|nr:MAG: molybdopterin dinucleotide-binding protein [Candidatus Bathyarchaeota archaeon]
MKVTLLTGRTIDQGATKEHGKLSTIYFDNVAICEIDPEDMKTLKLKDNATVKVTTEHGEVNVRGRTSKRGPHPGVVYMPYGIWTNIIIDPQTHGTGMPTYKGIKAEIAPAPAESVFSPEELLKNLFGGGGR